MMKTVSIFLVMVCFGLGLFSAHAAPQQSVVDGNLTPTILFDGGYISDIAFSNNVAVVSYLGGFQVLDMSSGAFQQIHQQENWRSDIHRVSALTPDASRFIVSRIGAAGEGVMSIEIGDVVLEPQSAYFQTADIVRVNDVEIDAAEQSYVGTASGSVWFVGFDGVTEVPNVHPGGTTGVSLLANGELVSGGMDGTVKLWSGQSVIQTITFTQPVLDVIASPLSTDQILVQFEDNSLMLWSQTSEELLSMRSHVVAWSPSGAFIAIAGDQGAVEIWNLAAQTLERTLDAHTGQVTALAWDGAYVASGGLDGWLRAWDMQGNLIDERKIVTCCLESLTGNGELFLFRQGGYIWEWNNTTQTLRTIFAQEKRTLDILLSPSGRYLLVDEYIGKYNFPVLYERLTDGSYVQRGAYTQVNDGLGAPIVGKTFSHDESSILLSLFLSEPFFELSVPNMTLIQQGNWSGYGLDISPDNTTMISVGGAWLLNIDRELTNELAGINYGIPDPIELEYSPDGQFVAAARRLNVTLMTSIESQEPIEIVCRPSGVGQPLDDSSLYDTYITFTQDSRYLICANPALVIYDLINKVEVFRGTFTQVGEVDQVVHGVELSTDETQIFAAYGSTFQVWQAGAFENIPFPELFSGNTP